MTITIAPYAITSLDRVKAKLTINNTGFDTILSELISGVTDFIETLCDRRFKQTTYTQELYNGSNLDGTPKNWLLLNNAPLTAAPASFQYRTGSKSNAVWVDFQVDTYQEILNTGVIRVNMPSGYQNIRVTYTAGYLIDFANEFSATHTLPFDLSDLADRLVTKLFKKRLSEGRESDSFNQSTIKWSTDMLNDMDKTIIANYSRMDLV